MVFSGVSINPSVNADCSARDAIHRDLIACSPMKIVLRIFMPMNSTVRWMNARLYIPLRETTIMECSAFTWDFYDSKTYRLDDLIYEYSHDMWWLNLTVLHYLTPELLMRTRLIFRQA